MSKLSHLSFALLFVLPVFAGCHSGMDDATQIPNPSLTQTGPGAGPRDNYVPPARPRPDSGNTNFVPGGGETIVVPPNNDNTKLPDRPATNASDDFWKNINNPDPTLLLASVHFGFDQVTISDPAERAAVVAAAQKMAADPTIQVVAVGHTDSIGSDQYNLGLSDRRANTVKSYAERNGAKPNQTQILAQGSLNAAHDVKKDSAEAKHDRRVDFVMIPQGVSATPPAAPPATGAPAPAAAATGGNP
jgi:outer membrane protein OmpA-like peptidoglycan-associated protein